MMAVNGKRLSEAGEVLGEVSVRKALKARRERRIEAGLLAVAAAGDVEDKRWYVLTTSPHAEISVEKSLTDAGVMCWLPMKKGDPARRGCRPVASRKAVLMPAFPGYIFVRVVASAACWAGLTRVDGVSGVLGAREEAFPVSTEIVNKLKIMIDAGGLDQTVEAKRLRKGSRVMVKDGPFAWFNGVVEGYAGTAHVRVLVSIFGRTVPVRLSLAQIAKPD
ncbi:MAG: transcription termination/antitermination NusG family protein [Rhizobiaceae bacterium]